MIDKEDFSSSVLFHFPQSRKIVVRIGKHVDEVNQIAIVLISIKTTGITPDLIHLK